MVITEAVKGFFEGAVKPVLDKWIPDAKDRLEAETLIFKQAHEISMGQIEINKIEAGSSSLFVSGWRPFIGWVCGVSLAYALVGFTFLQWVFAVINLYTGQTLPALPQPDTTVTMELVLTLLGLGGMRSWEKFKGLTK